MASPPRTVQPAHFIPPMVELAYLVQQESVEARTHAGLLYKASRDLSQRADDEVRLFKQRVEMLKLEHQALEEERRRLVEINEERQTELLSRISDSQIRRMEIIVSGRSFTTAPETIAKIPDSSLAETMLLMLEENENKQRNKKERKLKLRIDRDPKHFELILNYFREDRRSLHWLNDPQAMNMSDLEAIRNDADYYNLRELARFVTWELVSRKPTLSKETLPDILRLEEIEQKDNTSSPSLYSYKTQQELIFQERNFTETAFNGIAFLHKLTFASCDFRGSIFKNCFFGCLIDLRGCNISGLKLINCRSNMRELQPKDIFFVDNDQKGYLPRYWREFV